MKRGAQLAAANDRIIELERQLEDAAEQADRLRSLLQDAEAERRHLRKSVAVERSKTRLLEEASRGLLTDNLQLRRAVRELQLELNRGAA